MLNFMELGMVSPELPKSNKGPVGAAASFWAESELAFTAGARGTEGNGPVRHESLPCPLPRPSGRVIYSRRQDLVDGTEEDAAVARSAPSFRRL